MNGLSVHAPRAASNGRQQVWRIHAPERLLRYDNQVPDEGRRVLHPPAAIVRICSQPYGSKRGLDHTGGPEMDPVLLTEVE
jgi:hypothetical protein